MSIADTERMRKVNHARWQRKYYHDRRAGKGFRMVDAAPAREHIRAIRAAGGAYSSMSMASGVPYSTLRSIGSPSGPPVIQRGHHEAVMALRTQDLMKAALKAGDDRLKVPYIGTKRRIRALMAIGWPMHELKRRTGGLDVGHLVRDGQWRVYLSTAVTVMRVYEELWDVPGPSQITVRRAIAKGWAPPMAWDDSAIDDPEAREPGLVALTLPA